MADNETGRDRDTQVETRAKDSSTNKNEKLELFDLTHLWNSVTDFKPNEQSSAKNFDLPQLVVDKPAAPGKTKPAAALRVKDNIIDPEADHTIERNGVGIGQKQQGELAEDIATIKHALDKNGAVIQSQIKTNLTADKPGDRQLPVVYSPDLQAGRMGLLTTRGADGQIHYTPFVAGDKDPTKNYSQQTIELNNSAARELGIEKALKRGEHPKIDVIALPPDKQPDIFSPRTPDDLHSKVAEKFHLLAEGLREKSAEDLKAREATLNAPQSPDIEFGYRRTNRDAAELRTIAENFRKTAKDAVDSLDPAVIKDRMKDFNKRATQDVDKYGKEIDSNAIAAKKANDSLTAIEKQIADLEKKKKDTTALKPKLDEAKEKATSTNTTLEISKYNKSYAEYEVRHSKDETTFTRHLHAKASAAAALSLNPDMEGGLNGRRIVVNSGHWPGDPKFPGFDFDGTSEWKLNKESQEVYGEMIKMTGGAVKIVNQIDLPKAERNMTGLANAIKAAKPEAAISIHHDAAENKDSPAMNGTLTLHCAPSTGKESFDLGDAVHKAKINYGGLTDRYNTKGVSVGLREQCGRGIQGHDVDAPFILDEQFSTHKEQWPQARSPKWNAIEQFSKLVGVMEFLNKTPPLKSDPAVGKDFQSKIWSQTHMDYVWDNRKIGW